MPNNIIYLSQNAINNSNGTKNSFNGAEVAFAQAKGDNVAKMNTAPSLDPAWLQGEIDRLNVIIEGEETERLPRLTTYLREALVARKNIEDEINTGSLSMPFYCVSKVVNYVITERSLQDRVGACDVCNDSNMYNCMHYYGNLNGDGIRDYSLDITGGCSTEGFGNGWNITEGVGACGGDGSLTPAEIGIKRQQLLWLMEDIRDLEKSLVDLIKGVEEAKKERADLEMKLHSITI